MTDITTTLSDLAQESNDLKAGLAAATAKGTQAAAEAAAARAAAAAIDFLAARTKTEVDRIAADGKQVEVALTARATALTAANTAPATGVLSNTEAGKLKTATATKNGVSESDLDTKGVAAVTTLDQATAALGGPERTALTLVQADLVSKQGILGTKRDAAMAVLATIEGSGAAISAWLAAATAARTTAKGLNDATDLASHRAAVVAYADYAKSRDALAATAAADADGSKARADWTKAADEWRSALADAAKAEALVTE